MIQLIACDIDGTLLTDGAAEIDPEVFCQIRRLMKKNILFCPTSGRQYSSLRRLFAPIADELYFICENGALLFDPQGNVIAKSVMDREPALELARDILAFEPAEVLISGENMSYILQKTGRIVPIVRDGLRNNVICVHSADEIPEQIVKVSAFCPEQIKKLQEWLRAKWERQFQGAIAGDFWLDFSALNSDKGQMLVHLCRHMGIPPENVAAFGDNYNDLPILRIVGKPYLMRSAAEALRKQFPRQCTSVVEELKNF